MFSLNKAQKFVRNNLTTIIPLVLLIPLYIVVYKLYIPHVNAFGCFDDCFNYIGGYFINSGKTPFVDFFFNHQLIPPYISALIQSIFDPINIFDLVLRHKQFIILWSFIFSIILVLRFKLPAFFFIVIFELSKYYLFGDHFLAESLIIYPIVFLAGAAILKASKKLLIPIDYYLVALFTWFIIFSREPYIPLALFLSLVIFWGKINKTKYISASIFVVLTFASFVLINFNFSEYWFNLVTFNFIAVIPGDEVGKMWGPKIFHIFLYPLYILFYAKDNLFKILLIGIDIVFIINFVNLLVKKHYKLAFIIFTFLGLANLRTVMPASIYFEAYRTLIWFALFTFSTLFLVFILKNKRIFYISIFILLTSFTLFIINKSYFGYEKVNQQVEFLNNYGTLLQEGSVINSLSNPSQKFFIDGSDDLIVWQAKRLSDYKYGWYTSQMPMFDKYTDERLNMFRKKPPEFYREFGACPKKVELNSNLRLPDFVANKYVRLYNEDKPSCLFVRKDVIKLISDKQWEKAREFLYHQKSNQNETN